MPECLQAVIAMGQWFFAIPDATLSLEVCVHTAIGADCAGRVADAHRVATEADRQSGKPAEADQQAKAAMKLSDFRILGEYRQLGHYRVGPGLGGQMSELRMGLSIHLYA